MDVIDVLKLGSNINFAKIPVETNHYFRFETYARLNVSFIHQLNNPTKVFCQKHNYSFINNNNMSYENFW